MKIKDQDFSIFLYMKKIILIKNSNSSPKLKTLMPINNPKNKTTQNYLKFLTL